MFLRTFLSLCLLAALLARPAALWALPSTEALSEMDPQKDPDFAKPYEYERKAYGYDPEGVEYKQNQSEDFQVVFITATPFTALFSFGFTGLASLLSTNNFGVGGDYFLPFLAGTFGGAATIACVSVLTNKYPPPASHSLTGRPGPSDWAFSFPVLSQEF